MLYYTALELYKHIVVKWLCTSMYIEGLKALFQGLPCGMDRV